MRGPGTRGSSRRPAVSARAAPSCTAARRLGTKASLVARGSAIPHKLVAHDAGVGAVTRPRGRVTRLEIYLRRPARCVLGRTGRGRPRAPARPVQSHGPLDAKTL